MSKLGRMAAKAIRWITKSLSMWKGKSAEFKMLLRFLGQLTGQHEAMVRYLEALETIERTVGAHTNLWNKVKTYAARHRTAGDGFALTHDEAIYLNAFKKAWDDGPKKILLTKQR